MNAPEDCMWNSVDSFCLKFDIVPLLQDMWHFGIASLHTGIASDFLESCMLV